jgi:hypothetical protein
MQNPIRKELTQTSGSGSTPPSTNQPNYFGTMAVVMAAMIAEQAMLTSIRKGETQLQVDSAQAKLTATLNIGSATIAQGQASANLVEQDENMQIGAAVTSGISALGGGIGLGMSYKAQSPVNDIESLVAKTNPLPGTSGAGAGTSATPATTAPGSTTMTTDQTALLARTRAEIIGGRYSREDFAALNQRLEKLKPNEVTTAKVLPGPRGLGSNGEVLDDGFSLEELTNSCVGDEINQLKNGLVNARDRASGDFKSAENQIQIGTQTLQAITGATNAGVAAQADTLKAQEEANKAQAQMESQLAQDGGAQIDKAAQSQAALYQAALDAQKQLFSQESQMGQAIASR